jgi:hypothetical protein
MPVLPASFWDGNSGVAEATSYGETFQPDRERLLTYLLGAL